MTRFARYLHYSSFSILAAAFLAGTAQSQLTGQNTSTGQDVCMEPHCIILAADILSSLDTTQDPCNNFFDFANGAWLESHPIPSSDISYGSFEDLTNKNTRLLQRILESSNTNASTKLDQYDQQTLRKLSDTYSSCLNTTQLDALGIAPLQDFVGTLRQLYREGTDSGDGRNQFQGLTAALTFLHSQDVETLFWPVVTGDRADPDRMVAYMDQAPFALPSEEYYQVEPIMQLLHAQVTGFLTLLDDGSASNYTGGAEGLARSVIEFETQMVNISLTLTARLDQVASYNPFNATDVYAMLPQIDFPTYFEAFNNETTPQRLIVIGPSYIQGLSQILNDTPTQIIESYLVYRAALALYPYLGTNTDAWAIGHSLYSALTGVPEGSLPDRGEDCISTIQPLLGLGLGRFFVNATFPPEERAKVTQMIENIVSTFASSLDSLDWMDNESASAAAEKAHALAIKVGYPLSPNTTSSQAINEYYSAFEVDKNNYFQNILNARKDSLKHSWERLEMSRDDDAWIAMSPSVVNAHYNPTGNEIVFPAGMLQPPFHSGDWPTYLSYGGFGAIAGHELTHAFDSNGRHYDQDGRLRQWWTNATIDRFQVKLDCIVDQYSAYTIDDGQGNQVHIDGNLTSGENIGDSGLIQSLRTWRAQFNASLEAGNEYLLPGLNYTREQLFFINFARIWAQSIRPEAQATLLQVDQHSPNRYRVEGTLSNIPDFAKAFNCPEGSKLNPPRDQQCNFWG